MNSVGLVTWSSLVTCARHCCSPLLASSMSKRGSKAKDTGLKRPPAQGVADLPSRQRGSGQRSADRVKEMQSLRKPVGASWTRPPAGNLEAQANRYTDCLYASTTLPEGFRDRCRWLLDVAHLHCQAEQFYLQNKHHEQAGSATGNRLGELRRALSRVPRQWNSGAEKVTHYYSPATTADVRLLKAFQAMCVVLHSYEWYRRADLKRCVIEFLREHKTQELHLA